MKAKWSGTLSVLLASICCALGLGIFYSEWLATVGA